MEEGRSVLVRLWLCVIRYMVVVLEVLFWGFKYGCWKVVVMKLFIRFLGFRVRCWVLVFCSFIVVM